MLIRLRERLSAHREAGSSLISVLVVMLVLTVGALTLASIVVNTSTMLVSARGTAQSRAAADAAIADVSARGQRGEDICSTGTYTSGSAPRYSVSVLCDTSNVIITATGRGEDGGTTATEARYIRNVTQKKLNGAVVSASGTLNVSSLNITALAIDGDIVLDQGSFDCNNAMEIQGDLIVRSGGVQLSNACRIHGDVIAAGTVQIQNNAVGVGGDVYAMGGFTLTTSATIGGDVFTRGNATVNSGGRVVKSITAIGSANVDGASTHVGGSVWAGGEVTVNAATVVGSVTGAGTGESRFYGGKTGPIRIGGTFGQFQAATVTGDAVSTRTGGNQQIAPDVRISGNLTLAGTYTTWGTGPQVTGAKTQNAAGLTAPTAPAIATPWSLTSDAFQWIDLAYNASAWAGWTRNTTLGCNFKDNTWPHSYNVGVQAVNALTSPTIIDTRACTSTDLYNVTFTLRTDVTFLVSAASAQRIKINSADGAPHTFNIITPDPSANKLPTCAAEPGFPTPGRIELDDAIMNERITGIAYSPCRVRIGQSSGGGRWNGQVYAGTVEWGGNSSPRLQLDYREVTVPGFTTPSAGGGGAGSASLLGALLSLRDV